MSRPRKEGRKAKGVYNIGGTLYTVISRKIIKNGNKKYINDWKTTHLIDTDENVRKAIEIRNARLADKNTTNADKNILFEPFLQLYLHEKERLLANTTYAAYLYNSKHILQYFQNIKVKDITADYINDFLDYLFIEKNLSTRTAKDVKTFFYNIMEYAIKKRIITENPVRSATFNKNLANEHLSKKNEDEEFFSYEEAMIFLHYARNHKLYPLFHTTIFFGLRRSEVIGLKWDSINFQNGTLKIQHTVTRGTKVTKVDGTKTKESMQEYPLDASQIKMFKQLYEQEQQYRDLFGQDYINNNYIFKNENGAEYYPDYPSKAFKKIIKEHKNLPQEITFHGLRKSCASILIHRGYDIKRIQKWMRHADPETTLRIYAKAKDKESKKEIATDMIDIFPLAFSNNDEIK